MKYILMTLVCFCLWQCCFAPVSGWYDAIEKESEIKGFDANLVKDVFFAGGYYELNADSVWEKYHGFLSIYLDSVGFGKKWPSSVVAILSKGGMEEKIDLLSIEIRSTISGVGIFIKRKFIGDETHLKLILTKDEDPPKNVILDFDIVQKSRLVHHSRAYEWLRTF